MIHELLAHWVTKASTVYVLDIEKKTINHFNKKKSPDFL